MVIPRTIACQKTILWYLLPTLPPMRRTRLNWCICLSQMLKLCFRGRSMGWETNVCRVTSANSLIGLTAGTVKHLSLSTYYALASEKAILLFLSFVSNHIEKCDLNTLFFKDKITIGRGSLDTDYYGSRIIEDETVSFICLKKDDVIQIEGPSFSASKSVISDKDLMCEDELTNTWARKWNTKWT